jgi:hypothetical protein
MTAQATKRTVNRDQFRNVQLTLAAGQHAYQGSEIAITDSAGTCVVVTATTGITPIGEALEEVDASSAAKSITVRLAREVEIAYFRNHTSGAVAAANVGSLVYFQDDQTVTTLSASRMPAGRVWVVDSVKGVGVEVMSIGAEYGTALAAARTLAVGPTLTFTDAAVAPATISSGALYECPATAAASTITLPAAAAVGTWCVFQADGTVNDYPVTIADATDGAITKALPAGFPWQAVCVQGATGWKATVTVNGGKPLLCGALPAPDTGNIAVTAALIVDGGRYTLPALSAATTVTLAVTGVADGTQITVTADGGQGNQTTQYRFGTTPITAALTGSKVHSAVLTKYGSIWAASATVAP